jgi:hypothetical protein
MPSESPAIVFRKLEIKQPSRELDNALENQLSVMPIEIDNRVDQNILVAPGLAHVCGGGSRRYKCNQR